MTTSPPKAKTPAPKRTFLPRIEAMSQARKCGLTDDQIIKLVTVNVETSW